jgi:hypothetical protein
MPAGIEVIGPIQAVEVIAVATAIREISILRRLYGQGHGRKLKGVAMVLLPSGRIRICEIHWYDAHGIGRRKIKVKRFLDLRP